MSPAVYKSLRLPYHNYAGGSGVMAGSVFGRIAGESAARAAGTAVAGS